MTSEPRDEFTDNAEIENFWDVARGHAHLNVAPGYFGPTALESVLPPAWSFGGTPEEADELLALVLDGTKTGTASALWDYEAEGQAVPESGALSIILDGTGHPHALISTTSVETVAFNAVTAEHAWAEGEGDRSLEHWRAVHRALFSERHSSGRDFSEDMPVVLEQFEVAYQH